MIYQETYGELLDLCKQITRHRQKLAKPRIEKMILGSVGPDVPNEQLLAHLISESLLKRIDRQLLESKNIFVQDFDVSQTTLFYSMAEAVPLVYAGHSLANQYIRSVLEGLEDFTLFEIGIGNGKQVVRLLEGLSDEGIRKVTVFGLDPMKDNIDQSNQAIAELRDQVPFDVEFIPVCDMIENLTNADFEAIRTRGDGRILINSAFTLHHIGHPIGDTEKRTDVLKQLADLEPILLTLVEPNSDHDTEELPRRLHNCWQHFGNVFALVDESDIDTTHKFLIKEKFFGREIRNIFGVSDFFRSERHELYDSWLLRLHKAGFRPKELTELNVDLPEYCRASISDGLVRLNYQDVTIVAVMAAVLS